MTPFEAYKLFLAIKMHFTQPQYDFFKYNGKVNATIQSFEKRRDKYHFAKLAKHRDPMGYLVAFFTTNPNTTWIGELFTEENERAYTEYVARQQSITYRFSTDLREIEDDFIEYFKVKEGQHPKLLTLLKRNTISLETFTILNNHLNFFPLWDSKINDTVIWPSIRDRSLKYRPFIHYDKAKIKSFLRQVMAESQAK